MLGILRMLPMLALVAGMAYFYHTTIVNQKDAHIATLTNQLSEQIAKTATAEVRATQAEEATEALEEHAEKQSEQIAELEGGLREAQEQAQTAMAIFKRHNLERLARAKPGLIEPRMQNSTDRVFSEIEEATK